MLCATVQDSSPNSLSSAASRPQQPAVGLAGESVPKQVWQLCGVPANLQATSMVATADALLQLDSIHCPLEAVTCLQHADQAIAQAVGHIRQSPSLHCIHLPVDACLCTSLNHVFVIEVNEKASIMPSTTVAVHFVHVVCFHHVVCISTMLAYHAASMFTA